MAYIVKAFTPGKLNLAPETLEEEVLQNVAIIVSTPKFSVPLDRGLGLAQRFIDKPIQVAQSILISEVLDAVEEYEPRAEVTNVTFEAGETPEQALIRELQEEVGITPTQGSLFEKLEYQFPDRHITLWFWLVESWEGEPWGKEGQPAQWIAQYALNAEDFPPANAPVIEKLITG